MIAPLILRHAQDAAWLYSQFEADRASPVVEAERLRHFQRLLAAHLDGLAAAGEAGRETALAQMARWKGDGEFFVWSFLEIRTLAGQEAAADLLNRLSETCPGVDHGAPLAWALAWLPPEAARPVIAAGLQDERPAPRTAALDALGLLRLPGFPLTDEWWAHAAPGVRAAACRYAGRLRLADYLPRLHEAIADDQPPVRREAAVALLLCGDPASAFQPLCAAALECAAEAADGEEGAAMLAAERRAQHLARLAGHALPRPCPEDILNSLAASLPTYLYLLTLAHHGDPAHLPRLLPFMGPGNPYAARALRALVLVTGLRAEEAGLCREEAGGQPEPFGLPGLDLDAGLPPPNQAKIAQWLAGHRAQYPAAEAPFARGLSMNNPKNCLQALEGGPQDERFAAALHLLRIEGGWPWLDTRAPWAMQKTCLAAITALAAAADREAPPA